MKKKKLNVNEVSKIVIDTVELENRYTISVTDLFNTIISLNNKIKELENEKDMVSNKEQER